MFQERNQVFISYSHKDVDWLKRLQEMLQPYIRNNPIDVWDDTKIKSGEKWQSEIEQALAKASVAVLLVSPGFLASEFIINHELPPLLEAAEGGGLVILWVYIRHCGYEETLIDMYQAINNPSKPLDALDSSAQDEILKAICKRIKEIINPARAPMGSYKNFNPHKLPYLCDRKHQRMAIAPAIRNHQKAQANKPFLFLVHGNEYEAHQQLIDVMVENELPVALNLSDASIEMKSLAWPRGHKTPDDFNKIVLSNLGNAFFTNHAGEREKIQDYINHTFIKKPLLITVEIIERHHFNQSFADDLKTFVAFFSTNLELKPDIRILVALILKYHPTGIEPHPPIPRKLLGLGSFFKITPAKVQKSSAQCLRDLVSMLAGQVTILDELSSITEIDVLDWNNEHQWGIKEKDIEAIFKTKLTQFISMEDIVDDLRALLPTRY